MTMDDFEFGMPMEEMAAPPEGPPEKNLDALPPAENDADAPIPQPPEAGAGQDGAEAEPLPEEPPKKKRASRKKADKPEEPSAEDAAGPVEDGGEPPVAEEAAPVEGLSEADQLDPEAGVGPSDTLDVMGLADQEAAGPPADSLQEEENAVPMDAPPPVGNGAPASQPAAQRPERAAPRPKAGRPADGHSSLLSLKLNELDRGLTEQERQEWNDIYASFRSKSVLTGRIIGVDGQAFNVRNRETGQVERRTMYCAVIIAYRIKVLIPETEMWMPGEERPVHVLRNMSGAEIDYVILDVDREGGVAIGSRRMGAMIKQRAFDTARGGHEPGEKLTCRVLTVGPSRCLVECGGRDLTLRYQEMSYASYSDLREKYHPGETLDCVLKEYDRASGRVTISVKEAAPNPFEGARQRHPLGSRRQAVISGKYGGGVFCTLPDNTTCLCLYTAQHTDRDFREGDTVILVIVKYDVERSLIYGRILSKW